LGGASPAGDCEVYGSGFVARLELILRVASSAAQSTSSSAASGPSVPTRTDAAMMISSMFNRYDVAPRPTPYFGTGVLRLFRPAGSSCDRLLDTTIPGTGRGPGGASVRLGN